MLSTMSSDEFEVHLKTLDDDQLIMLYQHWWAEMSDQEQYLTQQELDFRSIATEEQNPTYEALEELSR